MKQQMEIYSTIQQGGKPIKKKQPTVHGELPEVPILQEFERAYAPETEGPEGVVIPPLSGPERTYAPDPPTPGQLEVVELPPEIRRAEELAKLELEKQKFEDEHEERYVKYLETLPDDNWEKRAHEKFIESKSE